MDTMFDGGMEANDVIVTVRFVRVDNGFGTGKLMHMRF
jgi:hypothetical protein